MTVDTCIDLFQPLSQALGTVGRKCLNPSLWSRSAGLNKARTATDGGDEQMFGAE
jgi:hypothetical protein